MKSDLNNALHIILVNLYPSIIFKPGQITAPVNKKAVMPWADILIELENMGAKIESDEVFRIIYSVETVRESWHERLILPGSKRMQQIRRQHERVMITYARQRIERNRRSMVIKNPRRGGKKTTVSFSLFGNGSVKTQQKLAMIRAMINYVLADKRVATSEVRQLIEDNLNAIGLQVEAVSFSRK